MAAAPVTGLVSCLFFAVHVRGGWDVLVGKSLALGTLWGLGLGLLGGWVQGLCEGLASGAAGRARSYAAEAIFFGIVIVGGIVRNIAAAAVGVPAVMAGYWLGAHWSARQFDHRGAR